MSGPRNYYVRAIHIHAEIIRMLDAIKMDISGASGVVKPHVLAHMYEFKKHLESAKKEADYMCAFASYTEVDTL